MSLITCEAIELLMSKTRSSDAEYNYTPSVEGDDDDDDGGYDYAPAA